MVTQIAAKFRTRRGPDVAPVTSEHHMQSAPKEALAGLEGLIHSGDLEGYAGRNRFKQFLDQVPVAIAVSSIEPSETIIYANLEFERLTNQGAGSLLGGIWDRLPGKASDADDDRALAWAVARQRDYVGAYTISTSVGSLTVDAWSNVIDDDGGEPAFRLVALVETGATSSIFDQLQAQVREKDLQLRELQHRVKNNLQMVTALIRIEARGVTDASTGEGFDRLAGRVEALGLLYRALSETKTDAVDLGTYISEIALAVMRAHAVKGIHLDLQADVWPASIDVAMPAGLVVNELLTNALKHAFEGRDGGLITVHCVASPEGCTVVVADDGNGLPPGVVWPKPGKLSSLIVQSLVQNVGASIDVQSSPGAGTRITLTFDCADPPPTSDV
jgi:two-component sensor histidine kinase